MISHGFTWFHFFAFGSTWLHLDSFGFTWFHLDSICFTRFHAASHGFTSSHLFYMVAIVCCWSHLTQLELHKENKLTQGKRGIPQWLQGKGKAATSRFSFCIHLTSTPHARTHERNETKRFPGWTRPPTSDFGLHGVTIRPWETNSYFQSTPDKKNHQCFEDSTLFGGN